MQAGQPACRLGTFWPRIRVTPLNSRVRSMRLSLKPIMQAVQKLSWRVADQAVSSLTHLAVAILVARSLGTSERGAFSVAFATYQVALNASRGLATDPLVVRYSGVRGASWRWAVARSTG